MEAFLTSDHVQTIILYSCFGALLGTYLYWIGYGVVAGVKWIIKKLKNRKNKKEENPNE